MATINYLIKGQKNETNILLRFRNGRKSDLTASTDLKVHPKKWSKAKQKVKLTSEDKSKDVVNGKLKDLKDFVFDEFNKDNAEGVPVDRYWLQKKISQFFVRPTDDSALDEIYFSSYVQTFIDNAPDRIIKGKNKPVSKGTITKYNTTLNKLKEYEERFSIKIKHADLNLVFYDRFVKFLSQEQKINLGTIGNYIGTIKTIARDAKLRGLPVHEHINHPQFYVPKTTSKSIYLNDQEIDVIFNYDFEGDDRLENARDLFIIGLRTGLRVSDFLKLDTSNLKGDFFFVETKKTGQKVTIPLHPQVKAILKKRNGLPRLISDQKFNKYIKDICEKVELNQLVEGAKMNKKTKRKENGVFSKWELVSSHVCRRSFATNLYGKVDNLTIMAVTGHQTETQFLKYIKITDTEKAEKLKEFWDSQL